MTGYRFVEQIDDRLRSDLMELYRHEWWTNQRRDEEVARMLQHTDLVVGVCTDPGGRLVGFTRVLTDQVFKAVIFDVIVAREHRGTGLGKRLLDYVIDLYSGRKSRAAMGWLHNLRYARRKGIALKETARFLGIQVMGPARFANASAKRRVLRNLPVS